MRTTAWILAVWLLFAAPGAAQELNTQVRAGDELLLRIWPDTSLSGRFPVELDGQVYLPMVGGVQVEGRSIQVVRTELVERFSVYLESPVVLVTPRFRVALLGAVNGPGFHWVFPTTTLLDLLIQSGGVTENAKPSEIKLLREGEVFSADVEAALEENTATVAIPLQSGDRILVPEGGGVSFYRVFQVLASIATLTLTIVNLSR